MNAETLKGLLAAGLPDARIQVQGGDGRYEVLVVGSAFAGLNRVKRQQLVYGCINDQIKDGSVHAVTIRAQTPDEAAG